MNVSNKNILVFAGAIILLLAVISGCLFQQNRKYAAENRRLIIQNDSIMSVNIELKQFLKKESATGKTSSLGLKRSTKNE